MRTGHNCGVVQRGRHWGMGSVVERLAGRWRLTVSAPADPVTGRRRRRTKTVVARSRSEALRALGKFASEVEEPRAEGGSATVRKAHTVLSLAFDEAVRWEQLTRNPAAGASPPRAHGGELILPSPSRSASSSRLLPPQKMGCSGAPSCSWPLAPDVAGASCAACAGARSTLSVRWCRSIGW